MGRRNLIWAVLGVLIVVLLVVVIGKLFKK